MEGLHAAIGRLSSGADWCVSVIDAASGTMLATLRGELTTPAASAPKVVLLLEAAEQIVSGRLDPDEVLERTPDDVVHDSGIWQDLDIDAMSVRDTCALVGAVSDNLATNVLLRRVGLAAVDGASHRLGLRSTRLLDRIRDERTPGVHPASPSTATTDELAGLMCSLYRHERIASGAAELVMAWLGAGVDLSQVGAGFGLDPLAHRVLREPLVFNKTGTDRGVRVDTGVVAGRAAALAYAVSATWPPAPWPDPVLDEVLDGMRGIGRALRDAATGTTSRGRSGQ